MFTERGTVTERAGDPSRLTGTERGLAGTHIFSYSVYLMSLEILYTLVSLTFRVNEMSLVLKKVKLSTCNTLPYSLAYISLMLISDGWLLMDVCYRHSTPMKQRDPAPPEI